MHEVVPTGSPEVTSGNSFCPDSSQALEDSLRGSDLARTLLVNRYLGQGGPHWAARTLHQEDAPCLIPAVVGQDSPFHSSLHKCSTVWMHY
jgi:hypothetical protein